jgi:hypothetical protein
MIAFLVEHDVSVSENGKKTIKDFRLGIHRVETKKPGAAVPKPIDSPFFIYTRAGESGPSSLINL